MTLEYSWNKLKNISIIPESSFVCLFSRFPLYAPRQPLFWYFSILMNFAFLEFHINGVIQHVCLCIWILSLSKLSYIMISRFIRVAIIVYPFLLDVWVVSSIYLLWIRLLWTYLCKSFCGHLFLCLVGKYLGELLANLLREMYYQKNCQRSYWDQHSYWDLKMMFESLTFCMQEAGWGSYS